MVKYHPTWETLRVADQVIIVEIFKDSAGKVEIVEIYDANSVVDISQSDLLELMKVDDN